MDDFSYTELQIVQSMLSKKPVHYIAMIINKPVQAVEALIKELLPGTGRISFADKQKNKALKEKVNRSNDQRRSRKRLPDHSGRKDKRVYKTRQRDYSLMMTVRIDHKTIIYAMHGEDPEECKKRYLKKLEDSKPVSPSKKYVEVKKFKPID